MFRITNDPSSGRIVQCLVKNYMVDSIVSVDMDMVSAMAAYTDTLCVCAVHCIGRHTHTHTHTQPSQYATITPTLSMSTDTIE